MSINILDCLHNDFMEYATEVNNNRAFPDVRDGLKPSMRACLWELYFKGYLSNKPHVKCAKVDGGVIGNWWPHGSEYSTIVRMSQPWVNNIPEIDWHGANGSLLGGPEAASSRYTECRLSKVAEDGLFNNIKKNAVDFIPNFSEDAEWPSVLPAVFPRLFVNGSQGIGYTIAQEWEPGNLKEFTEKVKKYIKTKKVDCSDIYPDYPTGGVIINKDEIHTIYETGKGKVILRGKTEIVDNLIRISELPYQVYAEPFIQEIKDLVNNEELSGVEDIFNKSDDNGLLIEIECCEDPEIVLNKLYKLTDLQVTFNPNQVALINGIPKLLSLRDYIDTYIDFNVECIIREYKYDLDKAKLKLEITDGLIKAISIIDDIIKCIKSSKDSESSKKILQEKFGFTVEQSKAIVDMRLGKLSNLETQELIDEKVRLNQLIQICEKTISSRDEQIKVLLHNLTEFTDKYKYERHTQVINLDIEQEKIKIKNKPKSEEDFIITLTADSRLHRYKLTDYKPQAKPKNPNDKVISSIKIKGKDTFYIISSLGNLYKLKGKNITLCKNNATGNSIKDLLPDADSSLIKIYSGQETDKYILFLSINGKVKKMETEELFKISKKSGTPLTKAEPLYDIYLVNDNSTVKVNVQTAKGIKEKIINCDEIDSKSKKAGCNKYIKLKEGQYFIK